VRFFRKAILATAIAGALSMTPAMVQTAASQPGAPQAADGTLGVALMAAVICSGGGLVRGTGVVSQGRTLNGIYYVVFERSVADCSYVATAASATPTLPPVTFPPNAVASVSPVVGNAARVNVIMRSNSTSSLVNAAFHLFVFCWK
jgi:hypothetical protein